MDNDIILVDKNDKIIGYEEKIKIHKKGQLHRAFSIFIFNSKGELLLQKRVKNKYHSGGLWSNTCCSHPRKNKEIEFECHKRLREEMGFDCKLTKIFSFIYKVNLENGFIENEFDHVFFGKYNGLINPNPKEVSDYKCLNLKDLKEDINKNTKIYSYWFKNIIKNHYPRFSLLCQSIPL